MDNLSIVAAIGKNRELGKDNQLLWKIPEDLAFFKDLTWNKNIIMGRKTFYSLPKKLSKRKHIVITKQNIKLDDDILVFHNINDLLNYCELVPEEFYVIGGASIYSALIDYVSKMYLTEINASSSADAYFPKFNENEWDKIVLTSKHYQDINYKRLVYKRCH